MEEAAGDNFRYKDFRRAEKNIARNVIIHG